MDSSTSIKLLDKYDAHALIPDVSPRQWGDSAFRARYNVPTIRVGGKVRFIEDELRAWLSRRREQHEAGA